MKAIVSTTFDDKYLFSLPIITWCWNKLGVDVICFLPRTENILPQVSLINKVQIEQGLRQKHYFFNAPEHKQATYCQVLRLYAACLDLPEDELLCTSDIDMILFQIPPYNSMFTIMGNDLTPDRQYPMCYANGTVKEWREAFDLNGITYQQAVDRLLGEDDCQHYRGNRWSTDQENLHRHLSKINHSVVGRSNGQNQFATKRYDRDDSFLLDRLNLDTIDFHLPRPAHEEINFNIIMQVLKYHYPLDNFDWLINYREAYLKLL